MSIELIIGIIAVIGIGYLAIHRKVKFKQGKKTIKLKTTNYKPVPPKIIAEEELELFKLWNDLQKTPLKLCGLCCKLAYEHCTYMIQCGVANHDNHPKRVAELKRNNALEVGEVAASGFQSSKGFIHNYMNHKDKKGNYTHRKIVLGDYTHFGTATIGTFNVTIVAKYKK